MYYRKRWFSIRKIITAIGRNELNIKLKQKENIIVFGNDIPYQDGVIDTISGNSEIDTIIINKELIGEKEFLDFLDLIIKINNKIDIIVLLKMEDYRIREALKEKGIGKVFNIEEDLDVLISKILNENNQIEILGQEIERLRKIIEEKEQRKRNNKSKKEIKIDGLPKVVAITGCSGIGKTLITSLISKQSCRHRFKTIMVDFDVINNSLTALFGINRNTVGISNICENLDIYTGIDGMFDENNKIDFESVKNIIDDLKLKYDIIFIDTSSETRMKYTKLILSNVDKILFLVEPNFLEVKKAEYLLDLYIHDWEVNKSKINLLLNRVNKNSIDEEIIKNIFSDYKIIEKIWISSYFTVAANNIKMINSRKCEKIIKKI